MKKWENLEDTGKNIVMIFIFGMVLLVIFIVIAVGISSLLTGEWSTPVETAEPNLVETHLNPAPTEPSSIISVKYRFATFPKPNPKIPANPAGFSFSKASCHAIMITIMRNRKANIIIALIGAFMVIVAGFFLVKKLMSTSRSSKETTTGITQDASKEPDAPSENNSGSSPEESNQKHKPMIVNPNDAGSSSNVAPQNDAEKSADSEPDNGEERNAVETDENEEQTESAQSGAEASDDSEAPEE